MRSVRRGLPAIGFLPTLICAAGQPFGLCCGAFNHQSLSRRKNVRLSFGGSRCSRAHESLAAAKATHPESIVVLPESHASLHTNQCSTWLKISAITSSQRQISDRKTATQAV